MASSRGNISGRRQQRGMLAKLSRNPRISHAWRKRRVSSVIETSGVSRRWHAVRQRMYVAAKRGIKRHDNSCGSMWRHGIGGGRRRKTNILAAYRSANSGIKRVKISSVSWCGGGSVSVMARKHARRHIIATRAIGDMAARAMA